MDPQRWQRLEQIYYAALPLDALHRVAYLANTCAGDAALKAQVESLLEADASSGEFLNTALFDFGLRLLASDEQMASQQSTSSSIAGLTLDGRYKIERELGVGGVGVVYFARDQKLHNKPVVVKVLLQRSQEHKWIFQKFHQEKEALARVDHPGVVGILDTGQLPDGAPYIVMQFVEGISLREAIKTEPEGLDLQRAAAIVRQATSALSAVHEKKIYHRDLKPENLMLQRLPRDEEQIKILDFGVAKVKQSLIAPSTATGAVSAGTVLYMSPEQLRGDKITASSDVYALGLIAYEIVTGRRPFKADTIAQLSEMQRAGVRVGPVDLRPRLPAKAGEAILRALAYDPADRYQEAADFGKDFSIGFLSEDEHPAKSYARTQVDISPPPLPADTVEVVAHQAETIRTPLPFNVNAADSLAPRPQIAARNRFRRPAIVTALIALVVFALGSYLLIANRERLFGKASAAEPQLALTYSLTVQKMRDGERYQEPFQSSGQEIFENDYKFRLNVSSPAAGYLYVFNEGADQNGALSFTIIYPTPATNNGSAKLDAYQKIQTSWNEFGGQAGTEQFWVILSPSANALLEAARDVAFKSNGRVADAAMARTVREFLTIHKDPRQETTKDSTRKETSVRGYGDVLVKLVELEHR